MWPISGTGDFTYGQEMGSCCLQSHSDIFNCSHESVSFKLHRFPALLPMLFCFEDLLNGCLEIPLSSRKHLVTNSPSLPLQCMLRHLTSQIWNESLKLFRCLHKNIFHHYIPHIYVKAPCLKDPAASWDLLPKRFLLTGNVRLPTLKATVVTVGSFTFPQPHFKQPGSAQSVTSCMGLNLCYEKRGKDFSSHAQHCVLTSVGSKITELLKDLYVKTGLCYRLILSSKWLILAH